MGTIVEQNITERHDKRKLFVSFPYYNNIDGAFFSAYTVFTQKIDEVISEDIAVCIRGGDSLVSRQRNGITRTFLESDASHLLFIDTDLVFSAEQVKKIFDRMKVVDICGGIYPMKSPKMPPQFVYNTLDNPAEAEKRDDGLAEVKYIGTGFLCISRKVFDDIKRTFGHELKYIVDNSGGKEEYDFWRVGVCHYPNKPTRYLSEDWYFCEMAKRCGYKVYADQTILLKHHGMINYPTPEQEIYIKETFSAGNNPEAESVVEKPCVPHGIPPVIDDGAGKTAPSQS